MLPSTKLNSSSAKILPQVGKPTFGLRVESKAKNTIRAYMSDLSYFCFWLTKTKPEKDDKGKNILHSPNQIADIFMGMTISDEVVVKWLEDNGFQYKINTIKRKMAAMSWCLNQLKLDDCLKEQSVKDSFRGLARLHAQYIARKISREEIKALGINPPLSSSEIFRTSPAPGLKRNALIKAFRYINENAENLGKNRVLRDKALLSLWWAGAFRRSEISTLQWEFIEFVDDGAIITLPISKTDQTGEGITKGIVYSDNYPDLCPVTNLKKWMFAAKGAVDSPFVFHKVTHKDNIVKAEDDKGNDKPMDSKSIVIILKNILKNAGIENAKLFSGHSPRRGFVTDAYNAKASTRAIQKQGGWSSERMLNTYIEEDSVFTQNASASVL